MTGYGEAQAPVAMASGLSVHVDLRGVNGRFLDVSFRLPDELRASETALRALLSGALRRGKLECRVSLESPATAPSTPDVALVEPLMRAQDDLLRRWPGLQPLSVAEAWRLAGMSSGTRAAAAELAAAAAQAAGQALRALQDARAAEGDRLRQFLLERCTRLRELGARAAEVAPQAVQRMQERFVSRFQEALDRLGGQADAQTTQERLLQEAAAFALRVDVAEEIGRLQSHLQAMVEVLEQGGEVGKRLEFLIQELDREANTLGSKSAVLELSELAVDMKVCIEQMREQVQNLE
ncbi:MAG: YicC family protein [Betaproteobacteria bacterium]|nr:YicC family protein [Betaproteobacteria bacterium]